MMPGRVDFDAEVWRLAGIAATVLQPVLVLLLCAMFVLATAHLLTMFGTRWGNKRVSGKAFLFSIGLHAALACGIIALWPEAVKSYFLRETADERDDTIRINQIVVETPLEIPEQPGETPVWEQLPDTPPPDWDRIRRDWSPDVEAVPERTPAPEIASLETPERTPLPLEDVTLPVPADSTHPGPLDPAAVPLETDSPEALAREDVEIPAATRLRSEPVQPADDIPATSPRPRVGRVDRLSPDPDPQQDLTSIAGVEQEQAQLADADEAASVTRREGPAPSTLDVDEAGMDLEDPIASASGPDASRPRIARERTRTAPSINETGVERYRPATVPQQPDAQPSDDPTQSLLATTPGELPSLEQPELENPDARQGSAVPAPYRMRTEEQREEAARQFGGTAESERAVEASLAWLAVNQHPDGYWDADRHGAGRDSRGRDGIDRNHAGRDSDTGITGLATLAFLAAGHTPREGEYAENVERALRWLMTQQSRSGSIAGPIREGDVAFMYCHAIATFALAEALALTGDAASTQWLRDPVERAVSYTLAAQLDDGGWRYGRYTQEGVDGDMSIFGWQLMALKSAELAGIPIPSDVRERMIAFLIERSRGEAGGLAAYRNRPEDRVTPPMTAEALFCKQMLGISRTNPASREAINYLRQYPPTRAQTNFYYWYYGTLAMFQYGGEPWEQWNESLRELLVADQRTTGEPAGSWDPNGVWGVYGGRVYSTAVATLCLEVYYRYHPVYRLGERYDEEPAADHGR